MKDNSKKNQIDRDLQTGYASPACFAHELDLGHVSGGDEPDWNKVNAWRKQQRTRLLDARDGLVDAQHVNLSQSVASQLTHSGWLNRSQSIAFFWPMKGEIDLRPLMTGLVAKGVTAALPVIIEKNQPLEFWQWLPGEALSTDGLWGIPVPAVRRLVEPGLLLVPMLGFDDQGHRMGFGGGYYDRSIAGMQIPPLCVGVCGEYGHLHSIYPQSHDMPMHAIASEAQFRVFSDPDQSQ